jgi:hypothetical protein
LSKKGDAVVGLDTSQLTKKRTAEDRRCARCLLACALEELCPRHGRDVRRDGRDVRRDVLCPAILFLDDLGHLRAP